MRIFYILSIWLKFGECLLGNPVAASVLQEENDQKIVFHTLEEGAKEHFKMVKIPIDQDNNIYMTPTELPIQRQNEVVLKKVFPWDGREKINNPALWPYCAHGRLEIDLPEGSGHGSGVLIAPNIVQTAAHNIYNQDYGGWVTKVTFAPAQMGDEKPFSQANALAVVCFQGWKNTSEMEYDLAFVILDQPIGYQTGWIGMIAGPDEMFYQQSVSVTGYPGDKGGKDLYAMSHTVEEIFPESFTYWHDTYRGQSGGALSRVWENFGLKTFGVHCSGSKKVANYGSRMSYWKLAQGIKVIENCQLKDFLPQTIRFLPPSLPQKKIRKTRSILQDRSNFTYTRNNKKILSKYIDLPDLSKPRKTNFKRKQYRRSQTSRLPEGWKRITRKSDGKINYGRKFPGKWVMVGEDKFKPSGYYIMAIDSYKNKDYYRRGGEVQLFPSARLAIQKANQLYYWDPSQY
jgi:V8-like Glu-specific endopeptidase